MEPHRKLSWYNLWLRLTIKSNDPVAGAPLSVLAGGVLYVTIDSDF
jgi:hypothetical protein